MNSHEVNHEIQRMNAIVGTASHRFHRGSRTAFGGEPVDWSNPLDELIAREEQALVEAEMSVLKSQGLEDFELPPQLLERIRTEVFEQFCQYENGLMEWLFAAGPHPLEVLRRLFAYVKMKRASLLWNMGFRQIGPLLKETHAAAQWRCRALFGSIAVGWSKPASSVEHMRAVQKKNLNRLGGKKAAKTKNQK